MVSASPPDRRDSELIVYFCLTGLNHGLYHQLIQCEETTVLHKLLSRCREAVISNTTVNRLSNNVLGEILVDLPDISQHVRLSAVCHRLRDCLAHRCALKPPAEQSWASNGFQFRNHALLFVLSRCISLESLTISAGILTEVFLNAIGRLPCAGTLRSIMVSYAYRDIVLPLIRVDQILALMPAFELVGVERAKQLGSFRAAPLSDCATAYVHQQFSILTFRSLRYGQSV